MTYRGAVAVAVFGAAGMIGRGPAKAGPHTQIGAQAPFDVAEKSIFDLQNAMRAGTITSRELVAQYLERIRKYDQAGPAINAFITLNPRALETAAALDDERRRSGERGILHGIPIVVKDNYDTADLPTTAASKALDGFQPARDAFQVKKLREAGAVIVGKTNLHELAYGITTISSRGGQTRNPYDPSRNPGGSSGGTAAAVAASFAAAGMGTDTCGSIRIPAANNNLVGLRGTFGLSSRDGIVPLAHSQDIGGPLARTVTDLAVMLDATVGVDPADPATTAAAGRIPPSYLNALGDTSLAGLRIGIVTPLFGTAPEDEEVAAIVRKALTALEQIGARADDLALPGFSDLLAGTSTINAELKFDLLDYFAARPTAPVRSLADILQRGVHHSAIDGLLKRAEAVPARDSDSYRATLAKREAARAAILAAMKDQRLQVLAYPTLRRKPAVIGQPQAGSNCQLSAATGMPAISMPAGFTADGLPVGIELLGLPWTEAGLLRIAYAYERAASVRRPPPTTP
jgi:Asp-tRNA(Asn)/Glu-tRNA(Gln) amidotransferase A subunit family amidase